MANITGASLDPILQQIKTAPEYHPLNANTFSDWSMEAGDIVTVTRDGNSYEGPVHKATVTWKQGQQVEVDSAGNEEREAVSKMSQRKYNRGNSSSRRNEYWHQYVEDQYGMLRSGIELTSSSAHLYSENLYKQMKSGLALTSSSAHLYSSNLYAQMKSGLMLTSSSAHLYSQNLYAQMRSGLALTSSSAHLYAANLYAQMKSGLKLSTDSAVLYAQNRTTRAQIIARINEKGQGEALIEAENVKITGMTKLNDVVTILSNKAWFHKYTVINDTLEVTNGNYFTTPTVKLRGHPDIELTALKCETAIQKAEVTSNGTKLVLTQFDGNKVTFNKATTPTLSGTWSSGKLTVKSDPTAQANYVRILGLGDYDWANDYKSVQIPIVAYTENGQSSESTGYKAYISTVSAWNAGYQAGGGGVGPGTINVNTGNASYHVSQAGTLSALAYAMGTAPGNLISIFGGRKVNSAEYYGFKVTCGSASAKYYYFVT